jgi:hypothetical protein
MNLKALSAAAAIAITSQAVPAAEIIGTRSGWEVFRDSKSCGMTRDYDVPGATQMTVIKYPGGDIRIMITNTEWSAKRDKLYDISYQVNGTAYGGAKAVGTADRARKGFVSTFVAGFAEDFTKGSTLRVLLSGEEIERLSLGGSGAAMALVDQCLVRVRASLSAAEREKEERAELPKDPFARPSRDSEP